MKSFLSKFIAVFMSFITLSACYQAQDLAVATNESEVSAISETPTVSIKNTNDTDDFIKNSEKSDSSISYDIETSDISNSCSKDYMFLDDKGILQIIDSYWYWYLYLSGYYSITTDDCRNIIIDDKDYIELCISALAYDKYTEDDLIELGNYLSVDLSDKKYYNHCPFVSIEELKGCAQRYFSNDYIENSRIFGNVIEENGSLYIPEPNKGIVSGNMTEINIIQKSDDMILFDIKYNVADNDIEFIKRFEVVLTDDSWLLNSEKTL